MSPLESDLPMFVRKSVALPLKVPAATPTWPIPSKEQTFPFLVFILAVGDEGRGGGFRTSRKRLFVWPCLCQRGGGLGSRPSPAGRAARPGPCPPQGSGPPTLRPGHRGPRQHSDHGGL